LSQVVKNLAHLKVSQVGLTRLLTQLVVSKPVWAGFDHFDMSKDYVRAAQETMGTYTERKITLKTLKNSKKTWSLWKLQNGLKN